jgi:hypothetical protein
MKLAGWIRKCLIGIYSFEPEKQRYISIQTGLMQMEKEKVKWMAVESIAKGRTRSVSSQMVKVP